MRYSYGRALKNWIPIKLQSDHEILCQWLYVGDKKFTDPFFDETISRCRSIPENGHLKKSMSSTDFLSDLVNDMDVIEPTAFIFHISRCGSTLISQMLATQPSNIVLSEVSFFDDLLRFGKKANCLLSILPQIKAAISIYGRKRNAEECRLFIKLDSWHIHFYEELRMIYPNTPFFLLFRNPHEVLLSKQKKRGMQSIPGLIEPEIFGFNLEVLNISDLDKYMSMVLESYLLKFDEVLQNDKNCYALNYHHGAMQMIDTIISKTKIHITRDERNAMEHRILYNAKYPDTIFSEKPSQELVPEYLQKSVALYKRIEKQILSE